jgi:hypothetical protein
MVIRWTSMRRATITLPDDLEAEIEAYLAKQEAPPSLTSLVQAALRRLLRESRRHRGEDTEYSEFESRSGVSAEASEVAEEPGVYEIGRKRGTGDLRHAGRWERQTGPASLRLKDLPSVLASLPRLSESEAEDLAADLNRAREEVARQGLTDPWATGETGGGSASGGA